MQYRTVEKEERADSQRASVLNGAGRERIDASGNATKGVKKKKKERSVRREGIRRRRAISATSNDREMGTAREGNADAD